MFDYALLPCPSFSPACNGAGRYDQVNTHQADDLPLQTDDQSPKTDDQALQPDDHALQPEDQTLQPDHQEYQENQPDMSPVEHIVEHPTPLTQEQEEMVITEEVYRGEVSVIGYRSQGE